MIKRNIKVPTGNICIIEGEEGLLEVLSIGDYGRAKNVKADFLGLPDDIEGVPNGEIMPLEHKWVVTMSTQYGCSMNCKFCDVPKVGKGRNATYQDLLWQLMYALSLHPEVKTTERLNIHFARMGEPTFNENVLAFTASMPSIIPFVAKNKTHPVISTMMPKMNTRVNEFIEDWIRLKNYNYKGNAGLQLSINSTNEIQRQYMFSGNALSLAEISKMAEKWESPIGRKYALNFALADDYEVDAIKLLSYFDPKKFMVKITPLHKTHSCEENKIITTGGYEYYTPYKQAEENLKSVGFDVLVFVPSYDEDKGRITCGNAILSGSVPECDYSELI
jgi:23S rRNA (adenine2503-C2)-methyltransferase